MKKKHMKVLIILGIVLLGILFISFNTGEVEDGKYDDFAKCLSENGAKMYGAFWCGHCKDQKKMFGSSWKYVDYIECAEGDGQAAECRAAGITGYPAWEFEDGSKMSGKIPMQQLSSITDCPLE
jgi:hypothetical protein|tara:strand:- start:128 stop:499 length:372 start_codon:yes stop_codon:yes gene_type:complete